MILREAPHRDGTISCDACAIHTVAVCGQNKYQCIDVYRPSARNFPTNFHLADQANLLYHFNEMTINKSNLQKMADQFLTLISTTATLCNALKMFLVKLL